MAKKVQVTVKDDQNQETTFGTKTLTKLFNSVPQGTHYKVYFQENEFGKQIVGDYVTKSPSGEPPGPTPNQPPVIELITPSTVNVAQHTDVTMTAKITDADGTLEDVSFVEKMGPTITVTESNVGDTYSGMFHAMDVGQYAFDVEAIDNEHSKTTKQIIVNVGITPPPPPPPPPVGEELYNSHRDSKLHDGKVRTIKSEGSITPNGLGTETRASGSPVIVVNADGTFSLVNTKFGRFYTYVLNYNAKLIITCAYWSGDGKLSLKMRSRHNESGQTCSGGSPIDGNRFGGYGFAPARDGTWDKKREPTHNCHDQSKNGSHSKIAEKQYFTVEFSVKDEGSGVRQIATIDGKEVMNVMDDSPKPFMVDKALYAAQSYFWVRQNATQVSELRVKELKVVKI